MRHLGRPLIAILLGAVGACALPTTTLDPAVAWRLPAMRRALSGDATRSRIQVLRFRMDAPDGEWSDEVVSGDRLFAERRERFDGAHYAFGDDVRGTWLRVGDGPVRAATGTWLREARTRRALFGMRFLEPRNGDGAELVTAREASWEYAFRPAGGQTITFDVSDDAMPGAFDSFDDFGRLVACEQVRWTHDAVASVLANANCRTSSMSYDYAAPDSSLRLVHAETRDLTELPAWAIAPYVRVAPARFDHAVEVRPPSEDRVMLDVSANGDAVPLVLDSGAFHTVLDEDTARRLGVVPTGEAPFYIQPPWLSSGVTWVGVIDHADVAGVPIDGMHVLVMEGLGVTGLLGLDFFERMIVDLDIPHGVVRLVPRDAYAAPVGAFATRLAGARSIDVPGEVIGVGEGSFTLDTGAPDDVVVYGAAMQGFHPRTRGSELSIGVGRDDIGGSPDYASEVDGLRFAGMRLPELPVIGRDHERRRVGSGLALVGMGLLRHARVIFDVRGRQLALVAGDGYLALNAFGVTIDADDGRPVVSRVVRGSVADVANVRGGDRIVRVNDENTAEVRATRAAVARASVRTTRLTLERRDVQWSVRLDPAPVEPLGAR